MRFVLNWWSFDRHSRTWTYNHVDVQCTYPRAYTAPHSPAINPYSSRFSSKPALLKHETRLCKYKHLCMFMYTGTYIVHVHVCTCTSTMTVLHVYKSMQSLVLFNQQHTDVRDVTVVTHSVASIILSNVGMTAKLTAIPSTISATMFSHNTLKHRRLHICACSNALMMYCIRTCTHKNAKLHVHVHVHVHADTCVTD